MHIPEGYTTESEVLQIIDDAVIPLANHFTFGYYDLNDMIQEGRMLAIEALPKYNPERGMTLKSFLTMHVRNRFITLHRNKLARQQPPCILCKHSNNDDCAIHLDKTQCEKWSSWVKRNMSKRALMETYDNDSVISMNTAACDNSSSILDQVEQQELIDLISDNMPLYLRSDFLRYKDGVKLSRARVERLKEAITEILGATKNG